MHETVAHPMQGLQVELLASLDGDETHVLPCHSFRDRLGIQEVVLVRFKEGFDQLCWNQPDLVALVAQCCTDEVCTRTGFDPDEFTHWSAVVRRYYNPAQKQSCVAV